MRCLRDTYRATSVGLAPHTYVPTDHIDNKHLLHHTIYIIQTIIIP